jgi:DNA-binding ferritin-like protein
MGNDIVEIRAHVSDMIAADRALLDPVAAQLRAQQVERIPQARWLLERLAAMLNAHIDELTEHLRRLGGESAAQNRSPEMLASELVNTAAPALNEQPLARSLRNYYTALSLVHAAALMLETDARAHNYSSTAAMATRHREEIATMLLSLRDLLPAAIKEEIADERIVS